MMISRRYVPSIVAIAIGISMLSACGGHGMVPTPAEQTQIESSSMSATAGSASTQSLVPRSFHHFMSGITLTDAQRSQLSALIQQFRQTHPPGSAFDRTGMRTLHQKMFAVLTPEQQTQFEANLQQMRAQRAAMHQRWMALNLTDDQRSQIHQLIAQYRQAHPAGSAPDPQAREQLHQKILEVLTPDQRSTLQLNPHYR